MLWLSVFYEAIVQEIGNGKQISFTEKLFLTLKFDIVVFLAARKHYTSCIVHEKLPGFSFILHSEIYTTFLKFTSGTKYDET